MSQVSEPSRARTGGPATSSVQRAVASVSRARSRGRCGTPEPRTRAHLLLGNYFSSNFFFKEIATFKL